MIVNVLHVHARVDFIDHDDARTLALVVLVALPVLLVVAVAVSEKRYPIHHEQMTAATLRRFKAKLRRGEEWLRLKLVQQSSGEGC